MLQAFLHAFRCNSWPNVLVQKYDEVLHLKVDQECISVNAHQGRPLPKSLVHLVDASAYPNAMHTPKPANVAQYLALHAPWLMPELISVMIVNKHLELDRPAETKLTHQHLTKQGDQREQIQRLRYVLLRLKLHLTNL